MATFAFRPSIEYLKRTAEAGQLLTAGDSTAMHKPGTYFYDDANDKGYVYVYAESALTSQTATYVIESGDSAVGHWSAIAIADTQYHGYVGAPATSVTTLKYGWVQVQGPVTAMAGLVSEARTAKGQMDHTGGTLAYLASNAKGQTLPSVFGTVRVANTAAATTGNIYLHGNRILPHT